MARALLSTSMTAVCLLLGACGDDKDVTTGNSTTGITSATTLGGGTSTGDGTTGSTTDDSGSGTSGQSTGGTTGPDTTTGGDTTTTGPDTTTTGVDETTGTTAVDPIENCLAMVEPGDECGECSCMSCFDELQACQMDEGCREIRICAEEAGCNGLDCFGPCGDVFNLYGGPFGQSGMLAQAIGHCVGEQCPGLCSS